MKYPGFLDDYAFLIQALLAVYQASGNEIWERRAREWTATMLDRFGDASRGGLFFTDASARDLIIRQKTASDSPLPSGNAIAAMVLMELGKSEDARRILATFADQLTRGAEGMSAMVEAALENVRRFGDIRVEPAASRTRDGVAAPNQIALNVVGLKATWAGGMDLNIQVNILDGFHINAHETSKGLVPTSLTVAGVAADAIEEICYPEGTMRRFDFADEEIAVYEGAVAIRLRFKKPISVKRLSVRLTYQACDEQSCLSAVTKSIDVEH